MHQKNEQHKMDNETVEFINFNKESQKGWYEMELWKMDVESIWWHTNDKENYIFKETETHRHTAIVIHILRKRCSKQRFYWKSIFHWFDHLIWFDQSIIQLQHGQ